MKALIGRGNSMEYGLKSKPKNQILIVIYITYLLISAVLSMQVSTQYVAYTLNYNAILGKYFLLFNTPIYPFWKIILWSFSNGQELFAKAIQFGQIFFLASQAFFLGIMLFTLRPKGNKKLHGSASWATQKEIKEMGYLDGQGVYVGALQVKKSQEIIYLRHNGAEHILCFAPTRSGKGVGLILPTLLSWQGSCIILDIKGENWALTAGYRKSLGHKVLRFDPTDITSSTCSFNPIEEVRLFSLFAIQDVQNIAMMIVDPEGKGLPDHWTKAAFAFFSGVILHCCVLIQAKEHRTATLYDLSLMMSGYKYEKGIKSLLTEMIQLDHAHILHSIDTKLHNKYGEEIHAFITSGALEMQSKADTEASGILSTALTYMAIYKDPIIHLNTSKSDFRINDLMNYDVPVSLYLVLNPANIDRIRPLIRLMLDMIMRRICTEMKFKDGTSIQGYKHRLLFMFDEFTSLGKLVIVEKIIAYIAGYGGKMYLIVQDISQLNSVYGKDNALMANCHIRIAYAPNTIETAKTLSEMTGKTTVVDRKISISYSKNGRSTSENISETARDLLTPDECMRLPSAIKDSQGNITQAGNILIFTAGKSPIYGVQILYFKDPTFMERAKIPLPQISEDFPLGITDSLYYSRITPKTKSLLNKGKDFDDYLKEEV